MDENRVARETGKDMPDRKMGQVEHEVNMLHEVVDRLNNVFGSLADRIAPVLSPELPNKETDAAKTPAHGVALVEELSRARRQLDHMADGVIRLTNRVEL